jgi:hypothetical protein
MEKAAQLYRESLAIKERREDVWGIAYTLESCAMLAVSRHRGDQAARLFGAAAGIRERLGTPLELSKRAEYDASLAEARELLDAPTFAARWQEGKAFSTAQSVDYAAMQEDERV